MEDFEDECGEGFSGDCKTVELNVPIPTVDQVANQMARLLIQQDRYERSGLRQLVASKIDQLIDEKIAAEASAALDQALTKPLQKTDQFGNPIGEPTSLAAVIADRIDTWASDTVDSYGKPSRDSYGARMTRLQWLVKEVTSSELQSAVTKEVDRIKSELKAAATGAIAKQIAERVAGMVLK